MSTPARSRWTAVVCRIVCGLMRFVAIDGTVLLARSAYCVTSRWIPNRVNGWLLRFKKTASLLPRLATSRDSDVAVTGREHHVAILPHLALLHTDDHAPALDRGGFEVNCFGNPKAGRIADGQDHPMLLASHRVQELGHFLLAQHVGQFLGPLTGWDVLLNDPVPFERDGVEEPQRGNGDRDRTGSHLLVPRKVDLIGPDLLSAQALRRLGRNGGRTATPVGRMRSGSAVRDC